MKPLHSTVPPFDTPVWTYEHARDHVVAALRRDADAQEQGRPEDIGADFAAFDTHYPRDDSPASLRLAAAHRFWDEWLYARDHRWSTPIRLREEDWPPLARSVAAGLDANEDLDEDDMLRTTGIWRP